jgi:hypothetical protein
MMDRAVYGCMLPAHIHHSITLSCNVFVSNELIHDELEWAFVRALSRLDPISNRQAMSIHHYRDPRYRRKIDSFSD